MSTLDDFYAKIATRIGQETIWTRLQVLTWLGLDPSSIGNTLGFIPLRPIDGVTDDWPSLFNILRENAYKNAILMLPGLNGEHWQCRTAELVPSGSIIVGIPGTIVDGHLATGSIENSIFTLVAQGNGATTTLAVNNTPGTNTIKTNASPAGGVDSYIQLQITASHLSGSTYRIISITPDGGGKFDVVLDRVVVYTALAANTIVRPVTVQKDIRILGNGMQLTGACESYIEIDGAIDCIFSDIVTDATGFGAQNSGGVTSDTFSVHCEFNRLRVKGPGAATAGKTGMWMIGEDSRFNDCIVSDWETNVVASDMIQENVVGLVSYNAGVGGGLQVTADGAANFTPSNSTRFIGCTIYGCSSNGIRIDQGSTNIEFSGCVSRFNGGHGCQLLASNGNESNCRFTNCSFTNNGQSGFVDIAGARGTVLDACDISNNAAVGVIVASVGLRMSACVSSGGNAGATVQLASGSEAFLSNCDFAFDTNAGTCIQVLGTGILWSDNLRIVNTGPNARAIANDGNGSKAYLTKTRVTCNANTSVLQSSAANCVVCVEDLDVNGTNVGGSVGLNQVAGSTYRLQGRIAVDTLAVPYNYQAGTFWSRSIQGTAGTIVTIGGAGLPVVVAWPDLKSSDVVVLTRIVDPAAVQPQPSVQQVAGTGFTVTPIGVADATAQYMYTIQ